MKRNGVVFALVLVGLFVVSGCSEDPSHNANQEGDRDTGVVDDAGTDDVSAGDADPDSTNDLDTDTENGDTGDGDVGADTGSDEDYEWPCPIGTREDDDGECVPVPTLRIQATDSLSIGDGQSFTDSESVEQVNRNLFVSASRSETAGSLPRENLGEFDRCRAYGAMISVGEVESFDAGPVTIVGLRVDPAVYTPSDNSSVYTAPAGIPLGDAYPTGATLTVSGSGTEEGVEPVFPSFEQGLQTIPTTSFAHDPVEADEPVMVSWDSHLDADVVRVDIVTKTEFTERMVVCETEDTGEYEVPAEMTSYLLDEYDDLEVSVYQSRTHRIEPEDSDVLIVISASNWMRRE